MFHPHGFGAAGAPGKETAGIMEELIVLDDIEFVPNLDLIKSELRIKNDSMARGLAELAETAREKARPKAMFRPVYIDEHGDDYIVAEGTRFHSRVLAVNLADAHRMFPYAVTCGTEIADWGATITDMLDRFYADALQEKALRAAVDALQNTLKKDLGLEKISYMSPGSLGDWPIEEQKKLFGLLGDPGRIGMTLTDSFLMTPIKSLSGIYFPTEQTFFSCMLCPREDCRGRKAAYNPTLYREKYGKP